MVAKTKAEVAKIKDDGSKTWNRSSIKMDGEKKIKKTGDATVVAKNKTMEAKFGSRSSKKHFKMWIVAKNVANSSKSSNQM